MLYFFLHVLFQIGFVAGVSLAVILGVSFSSLATLFTKDVEVLRVVRTGVLVSYPFVASFMFICLINVSTANISLIRYHELVQFVSVSQPLNALAFIFDGLHYGVSDFPYAARSMVSLIYFVVSLMRAWNVGWYMWLWYVDGGGGNIFCIFAICSYGFWSSWCLVRLDSLHGTTNDGRNYQVNWGIKWHLSFFLNYAFVGIRIVVYYSQGGIWLF